MMFTVTTSGNCSTLGEFPYYINLSTMISTITTSGNCSTSGEFPY